MTDEADGDDVRLRGEGDHESGPTGMTMEEWDLVLEDMAATADEYEAEGWETLQFHPGDVTPEPGDEMAPGLDVVLPDNEYEQLTDRVGDGFDVDEVDVLRADSEVLTYVVFALEDPDYGLVALVPTYYRRGDEQVETTFERALDDGALELYLRRLSGEYVGVTIGEPGLVAPAED